MIQLASSSGRPVPEPLVLEANRLGHLIQARTAELQRHDVPPLTLSAALHTRFRQVYGEPLRSMGDDHLWSFRSGPSKPFIHILIDGHSDDPVVWVLDPYETSDSEIYRTSINQVSEIDDFMTLVHERIKRAAKARVPPS